MPKITVVIPVYKVEKYLCRCVDSILNQTYKDYEIILIDDGSPDNCPQICDDYKQKYNEIKVIHKENGGLTSARFAGFQIAQGDFIIFIDSDDYIHPQMLEKLYNVINMNEAQLAVCSYNVVADKKITPIYLPLNQTIINRDEFEDKYILPLIGRIPNKGYINLPGFLWLRMFSRNILSDECFVSERKYFTEDDLFNLVYVKQINRITIINEPLYYYVQNEQSLTNIYRRNAWNMLVNQYYFCVDYCKRNDILKHAGIRLKFAILTAITFSIDNACKLNNFKEFLSELKEILYSEEYKEIKEIPITLMTQSQRIDIILCKLRLFKILYLYRKLRFGLKQMTQ